MRLLAQAFLYVTATVTTFTCLWILWAIIVAGSGGAFTECDRGDCGAVFKWTSDNWELVAGLFGAVALLTGYLATKRILRGQLDR
jgi:hypothetical protein